MQSTIRIEVLLILTVTLECVIAVHLCGPISFSETGL